MVNKFEVENVINHLEKMNEAEYLHGRESPERLRSVHGLDIELYSWKAAGLATHTLHNCAIDEDLEYVIHGDENDTVSRIVSRAALLLGIDESKFRDMCFGPDDRWHEVTAVTVADMLRSYLERGVVDWRLPHAVVDDAGYVAPRADRARRRRIAPCAAGYVAPAPA